MVSQGSRSLLIFLKYLIKSKRFGGSLVLVGMGKELVHTLNVLDVLHK